jgi:3-dehydroquinate synthase
VHEILIPGRERVLIGRGLLDATALLGERDRLPGSVAVFTQPGAAPAARSLVRSLRREGAAAELRVLPDGEAAKDLAVAADCYRWLGDLGVGRDGLIVGVGGGSITDVAGFVASTWLRGVEVIHVPTTVLAAVDAAVGGKTGVDLDGKNLVGTFHSPSLVLIDVDIVEAAPPELRREGFAEALKCGLIADGELLRLLETEREAADLEEVVRRAVSVKAAVVTDDFREAGTRQILNYGHTIGHAVEAPGGFRHGPAVAIGMAAAGRVSALVCGFPDEVRQREAIEGLGLPTTAPGVDRAEVHRLIERDKKRRGAEVRMVLLEALGMPRVSTVDRATVDAALTAIGIA